MNINITNDYSEDNHDLVKLNPSEVIGHGSFVKFDPSGNLNYSTLFNNRIVMEEM